MKIGGRIILATVLAFSAYQIASAQQGAGPLKPGLPWQPVPSGVYDPGRPGYQDGKLSNAHDCNTASLGCNVQGGFWKTGDGQRYRYGHPDRFGVQ